MTDKMLAIGVATDEPLGLQQVDKPTISANQVMVKVAASGLNRADLVQRKGAYPPPPGASEILGLEVTGTIVETGANVTEFKVGDRVGALLAGGGYAEYAAVDQGSLLPLPDQLSFEDACCFPEALFTVWANIFDRVVLQPGENFLCHGGTSGIGVMAIQMAKAAGAAKVFATAGTAEKCALATSLGADIAINYRQDSFEKVVKENGGADVILDMVGSDYVQRNISASNIDGRIINIAYQNGFTTEVNFAPVLMKRLTLAATTLRARPIEEKQRIRDAVRADFWPHVVSGKIKPVLDSTFAASNAELAHQKMESGQHSGKIVLTW